MRVFFCIWAICLVILFTVSPANAEFKWQKVGADPNQLDHAESIKALGLPEFLSSYFLDTGEWVEVNRGEYFKAMNFGQGKVRYDVVTGFEQTHAEKWSIPIDVNLELFKFDECGNYAFRLDYEFADPFANKRMIKAAINDALKAHTLNEDHSGIPWWLWLWLILSTLGLIWALLRRGREGPQGY